MSLILSCGYQIALAGEDVSRSYRDLLLTWMKMKPESVQHAAWAEDFLAYFKPDIGDLQWSNEFDRRKILAIAEQASREIVASFTPPAKWVDAGDASLGEYDFGAKRFPISTHFYSRGATHGDTYACKVWGQCYFADEYFRGYPASLDVEFPRMDFYLALSEERAEALLRRLPNRSIRYRGEFEILSVAREVRLDQYSKAGAAFTGELQEVTFNGRWTSIVFSDPNGDEVMRCSYPPGGVSLDCK